MANRILFLCTGNYYRSRFAEILFNSRAVQAKLNWRADSRGLALEKNNIGPMSKYALKVLEERGIELTDAPRYPIQVQGVDFEEADLIIALKEAEHRPYLSKRHPIWVDKVEYWHIHDGFPAAEYDPLKETERGINALIQRL
ncbi:low molecular weight phosphatase family protein [Candidatus Poribacteria bacterium]|nr:low molecular weight phosphatase family protein [Candidatus Poribacteria bacterium]